MAETISSSNNPLVKQIRMLTTSRRHRRQSHEFFVEGAQPVGQAVEAGWEIRRLVLAEPLLSERAQGLVERYSSAAHSVVQVSARVFSQLSSRDGPSGIGAVVGARSAHLDDLCVAPDSFFVVLDRLGNPGNIGTIIRTANAAGAAGVILVGASADEFDPVAIKASMGAVFSTSVSHCADFAPLFDWCASHGVSSVATSGRAQAEHWSFHYRMPVALLLGNEGQGLPDDALARADHRLIIPMSGTAESLNVAAAAAIMLYEVKRQAQPGPDTS